ncbi:16S rRNA (cytosine(1402)-N(4))-methyltransferase RsmH [Helicobacter mustelae]|uniref:Ribosomal RNA small subunit methyltransferase H n=1 Tax=Helicobacter mustelae (strain ATCC 43772 / CCUG 25715 / CIP 103759 / LMG 18044 / NCTC 12198 / R85-136P) TaxID=679897 RepID=D3UHP1_HELM1|nr:16S rRNA (cytosine(1402)-N(4))-methyltransferase RsmH [Helicobacter mustelae]CBG40013.1 putative S-adenosyl-L-methionine-dependent methyltransferase mraW [Helicobacter mustelae 12198]SQH71525.1 S-adenosyl-L-methionine-dependent methyltransferase mraW [Helicobacter mustelae]STP12650.1 S-adenosyl-L-methionine-dependent methyltransferase mraW [Helicobacter mustelae]
MHTSPHIPVLLHEVLDIFKDIKEGIIIDCTLGFGGHSKALLEQNQSIRIIGIDKDKDARAYATKLLSPFKERFCCVASGFGEQIEPLIAQYGREIKGVLADIGVSSYQLDTPKKGFGFESEVLDMRMDNDAHISAKTILNHYSAFALERVFREYGELRESKKLAQLLSQERTRTDFGDPKTFNAFLKAHFRNPKILPLVYQALRIEVNGELEELERLLLHAQKLKDARLCVITFHSLEDRILKQALKSYTKSCICPLEALKCTCGNHHQKGVLLTKKPIIPSQEEIKRNPRSRSAKMRAFHFG